MGLGHQGQGGVGAVMVGVKEAVRGEGGGQTLGGSDDSVSTGSTACLPFQTLAASRWRGNRSILIGQLNSQQLNNRSTIIRCTKQSIS